MVELFGYTVDIGYIILTPTFLLGVFVIKTQWHHLDKPLPETDKVYKDLP